ncbi:hypothetical protein [Desulfosarcina sp.]|uniref:hypothetical protein n=1 Tax=Desulfosarcina sp. TaxID=2027861 RepID=UPI00356B5D8F
MSHTFPGNLDHPIKERLSIDEIRQAGEALNDVIDAFILGAQEPLSARHQLRALIEQYPELSDRIPELIAQHHRTDRTAADLIHLLELAGHEAAQRALVTLVKDSTADHLNRIRATVALGGVQEPSQAALNDLWRRFEDRGDSAARDISNTAFLSIGCIAANQRIPNPESYATLADRLMVPAWHFLVHRLPKINSYRLFADSPCHTTAGSRLILPPECLFFVLHVEKPAFV